MTSRYTQLAFISIVLGTLLFGAVPTASAQWFSGVFAPTYLYQEPLTCTARQTTIALGDNASFVVNNPGSGPFSWKMDTQTYLTMSPVFSTTLYTPGRHTVVVSNMSQSAVCMVEVSSTPWTPSVSAGVSSVAPAALTYRTIAALPNAGIAPLSSVGWGFLIALVTAFVLATLPLVVKVLARS